MNNAGGLLPSLISAWRRVPYFVLMLALIVAPISALAQETKEATNREVSFEWEAEAGILYMSIAYRDVVSAGVQSKLSRGLPTTLVLTAAVFRVGSSEPLSTTAQSCKVTWHVWEEAYRLEITRPGGTQIRWTTTVEGVLRRCAEAKRLLAGDRTQVPRGVQLYATGKVQLNPVSPEVLQKIKRWVMRPSGTGTAAPGDALFSTFTGLFLQRIGEAERELKFTTKVVQPTVIRTESK